MTRICVFSDSHGDVERMKSAVLNERPDLVIHLGDCTADCDELRREFSTPDIRNVRGNCDRFSAAPELLRTEAAGKRIFAAHGHRYDVKNSYNAICYAAMEAEADILLFGHTHIAYRDSHLGMEIMNPGSIGRGISPSYGVILIDGGEISTFIVRL